MHFVLFLATAASHEEVTEEPYQTSYEPASTTAASATSPPLHGSFAEVHEALTGIINEFSMDLYESQSGSHRVKFLKTFEFGAQRGEGYRGESALLCSQFQTQF